MATGFRPFSDTARKAGVCRLCGERRRLTQTHVPPKAALNDRPAAPVGTRTDSDGTARVVLGRRGGKGAAPRRTCASCNGTVKRWDDHYTAWALQVFKRFSDEYRQVGPFVPGQTRATFPAVMHGNPGAFVRSALAGLLALTSGVEAGRPDLMALVLDGVAGPAPSDLSVLLGYNIDSHTWVMGGPIGRLRFSTEGKWQVARSGLVVPSPVAERLPLAVISNQPFSVLLVERGSAPDYPHEEISSWLEEDPGTQREVSLLLPIITTPPPDPHALPTPENFQVLGSDEPP